MISFTSTGSFSRTEAFLKRMTTGEIFRSLSRHAATGTAALANATPKDSALTASSWTAEVKNEGGGWSITWSNTNKSNGFPVAIMLQYGHGTGTGGYVKGRDYINPAIKPIFDKIADDVWKEVTRA